MRNEDIKDDEEEDEEGMGRMMIPINKGKKLKRCSKSFEGSALNYDSR